jgi:hypothetical protein
LFHTADRIPDSPNERFFVAPVTYGEDLSRQRQRDVITRASDCIEGAIADPNCRHLLENDRTQFRRYFATMASELTSAVLWNSLTCKHAAYEGEEEVRLITSHAIQNPALTIETRIRNGMLVPYVRMSLPIREKGNIAQITVGPAVVEASADAARLWGKGFNLSSELFKPSGIPYRPL